MFKNVPITLGQYRPLDSFLHKLDARSKMVPVMLVLTLALFTGSYLFYLSTLVLLVFALFYSGIQREALINSFKPVLWLVVVTVFYHLIFSGRDTETLITVFSYRLTVGAVDNAAFYSLRLVLFVSIAFLVTLTSSPSELADAFGRVISPLRHLKVPVEDLSLILFMAIRFIPVLYEEFTVIRNAQMLRGVDFSGSVFNRLRRSTSIIIPVFVAAIGRADELAQAIEVRGYGCCKYRTFFSRTSIGLNEIAFAATSAVAIIGLFYFTL